ncbi:hypothetical protein KKG56_04750, partial [bacterium]|nr:hypothetical protein [bacterium]
AATLRLYISGSLVAATLVVACCIIGRDKPCSYTAVAYWELAIFQTLSGKDTKQEIKHGIFPTTSFKLFFNRLVNPFFYPEPDVPLTCPIQEKTYRPGGCGIN